MSKELKRHSVRGVKYNGEEICGGFAYYDADDVDALLAEKDAAIAELKKKLMPCLNGDCILTCEVVEKYGKENAELKAEIESLKASHYAEMVDAGMRERRLRRALWLARSEKAKTIAKIYSKEAELILLREHYPNGCGFCHIMKNKWRKVEQLCMAKAEKYK